MINTEIIINVLIALFIWKVALNWFLKLLLTAFLNVIFNDEDKKEARKNFKDRINEIKSE